MMVLLILLALNIDYLSRFFIREESWSFTKTSSHKEDVADIIRQINLPVVSTSVVEKLMKAQMSILKNG